MRRTTLAVVLATGALAVPAVALAAGGDDPSPQTAPTQQNAPEQQPAQPDQQRPDRGDCPEHDGSGTAPAPSPESGGSSGSDTTL
jgi:hypothetical protein